MKISEFTFELPEELIAQTPSKERGNDRLLVVDRKTGAYQDAMFCDFPDFVEPNSLLVVNDTKVRKARVYGISETGGKVEFLFTEPVSDNSWQAMVSRSKKQFVGKKYVFNYPDGNLYANAKITADNDGVKTVTFDRDIDEDFFIKCGHVPLPPYIKREDDFNDESRYQTIYARDYGSMAAPTAGLHMTEDILSRLEAKGVEIVHVTLQVGMGTFLPVRTENLEDHHMHTERYHVTAEAAEAINAAKKAGRKIVAVGTTSVRTLESCVDRTTGLVRSGSGSTDLFITPGFTFRVVDQMVTNFHTPESTLLVLVSAFCGRENILNAYKHAVQERYRFFSYGDATFLK